MRPAGLNAWFLASSGDTGNGSVSQHPVCCGTAGFLFFPAFLLAKSGSRRARDPQHKDTMLPAELERFLSAQCSSQPAKHPQELCLPLGLRASKEAKNSPFETKNLPFFLFFFLPLSLSKLSQKWGLFLDVFRKCTQIFSVPFFQADLEIKAFGTANSLPSMVSGTSSQMLGHCRGSSSSAALQCFGAALPA